MRLAFRLFFLSSAMEERSKYLQGASYARHVESEVAQSCPIFCHPIDCSLPGSSVYGIFQARALEWAAISFSMSGEVQSMSLGYLFWVMVSISWKKWKLKSSTASY